MRQCASVLLALGLILGLVGTANAGRTPSVRTVIPPTPGARGDITVPYTSNGFSTLGVYNGVAPLVVSDPLLTRPLGVPTQPTYNLIYYGSRKGFSSLSAGSTTRAPNNLRGN